MALREDQLQELAKRLAKAMDGGADQRPTSPRLRLVTKHVPQGMDSITRDSHYRMIRHYRHHWGPSMQLLIDQACFGLPGIEELSDDQLVSLHQDLERALDCIRDGVTFEDAGLLRARYV